MEARKLAAILAADIAGYSALMGADEARTVRDLKGHQAVVLPMIGEHGGRVIDTAGDGILAEFASVVNAVECAVTIQKIMAKRNADVEKSQRMEFRIGVNLGDVIHDDARLYGDGVNIAARLEAMAEPGGICVSAVVHDQVHNKLPLAFTDLGKRSLKNIAEPVQVYRVEASKLGIAAPAAQSRLTLPDKPSIAVLPFANMSEDKDQEYLADGMVEDILTALSHVSSLFVVARNSSFAFKGKNPDIRDVGRQLGVRYVLEGSVRRSADRLRVTAQLIDAANGAHVWAERYDRRLQDIFDIQDELTKEIVTALRLRLSDGEQATIWLRSTNNVEAWGYATRGEDHIWRGTAVDMAKARALLDRAVACDPEYAKAIALIGLTHYFDVRFHYTTSKDDSKRKASELALKALALDAEDPYAIWMGSLAKSLEGQVDEAVHDMQRLVARIPNHALLWLGLARLLVNAGRSEEGERAIRHAMRLNPLYPINYLAVLGDALVHQSKSREALDAFKEIIARQPNYVSAHLHLAALHSSLGEMAEARAQVAEVLRINPQYRVAAAASFYVSSDETRRQMFLRHLRAAGMPE